MQNKGTTTATVDRFGLIAFNQVRARLEPMLKINDHLSIHTQFDVLDNVVFGSQATKQLEVLSPVVGTLTLPAQTGSVSLVGGQAGENGALNFRRAYMDILFPVGKLRVGRQPSHWGLGIFQNDGNGRQDDFGDSADRVLYMAQFDTSDDGALSAGLAWDIAYEAQRDPRIGGVSNIVANSRDISQYAAIILYEQSDFSAGVFGGFRRRSSGSGTTMQVTNAQGTTVNDGIDGNTLVYFADLYARYSFEEYDFKAEYVFLGGKMSTGLALNAVPFNSVYSASGVNATGTAGGIIALPAKQDVQVSMAAFEATGSYKWGGEWDLKSGFAQGDASPLSQRITQYGFRPDYHVALLMFNVPLGTSPALVGASSQAGGAVARLAGGVPITGNFVNNAIYVSTGYQHHLDIKNAIKDCNDFSVGGRVTTAWAHKNPLDLNFQALLGDTTLPIVRNSSKWYGVEGDIVVESKFYDHLYAGLEAGLLFPGSAYDSKVDSNILGSLVQAIPAEKAKIAYGGRLTLMIEF